MRFYGQGAHPDFLPCLSSLWWSPALISILGASLTSSFSLYHPPLLPLRKLDMERQFATCYGGNVKLLDGKQYGDTLKIGAHKTALRTP